MKKTIALFLVLVFVFSCAKKEVRPTKATSPGVLTGKEHPKLPELPETDKKTGATVVKPPVTERKTIRRLPEPVLVQKEAEQKYIILNFDEADIQTVISTVGELLGINYILTPGISGKVTIQSYKKFPMKDLFQIFQTILEMNGLTAVQDGPLYRIVPIDSVKQQPIEVEKGREVHLQVDSSFVTQIIPLDYVKASDAANILKGLMPRGADLIVYEPTNLLLVTAKPQAIVKFMKILEAIDIPPSDRENIRTFVYYVENGEAKKLADILKTIYLKEKAGKSQQRPTIIRRTPVRTTRKRTTAPPVPTIVGGLPGEVSGEITITAYEDINAIIIKASPGDYLSILETLKRLDIPPKQVLIEVLIGEVTLTDDTRFGVEWLIKNFGNPSVTVSNINLGEQGLFGQQDNEVLPKQLSGFSSIVSGVLNASQVKAVLNYLISNSSLNVLASPHILALDNKEAKIEIGDEIPVATGLTQQPSTGTGATTLVSTGQIQYRTAGIILNVTPHISEKGKVTLKISQEFSSPGQTYKVADQAFQGFITRKAETTGVVQDGHSLLIGGLISDKKTKSRTGIPLLSDLPVLGNLFSTTSDQVVKTELMVMVTPHVLKEGDDIDRILKDFQERVKTIKEEIKRHKVQ